MNPRVFHRKLHRIGAIVIALPLLCVLLTGLLLQLKKEFSWIQPATKRAEPYAMELAWPRVLEILRGVPEAEVREWSDIDRIDVQPKRGIMKLTTLNRYEVQLALADGAVLQVAYRRSDWIESLHDGSFFGEAVKLGVFLPSALILLVLYGTGLYLWWLPHGMRRKKRRAARAATANSLTP